MPDLDDSDIHFPLVEPTVIPSGELRDFSALDDNTQRSLMDIIQSGSFAKMDLYQREVLIVMYAFPLCVPIIHKIPLSFSFCGRSVIT